LSRRKAPYSKGQKALLSHCFTKAMVQGWVDANPCRGVHRNRERPRERMIDDAEAAAVFAIAVPSVRLMMTLIYASCQRPEDSSRLCHRPSKFFQHVRSDLLQQVAPLCNRRSKVFDCPYACDVEAN
jgi:hypothetical protein